MTLDEIRQNCEIYKEEYECGRLTATEYKELLEGINLAEVVAINSNGLEEKEALNTYINATINILSAV